MTRPALPASRTIRPWTQLRCLPTSITALKSRFAVASSTSAPPLVCQFVVAGESQMEFVDAVVSGRRPARGCPSGPENVSWKPAVETAGTSNDGFAMSLVVSGPPAYASLLPEPPPHVTVTAAKIASSTIRCNVWPTTCRVINRNLFIPPHWKCEQTAWRCHEQVL